MLMFLMFLIPVVRFAVVGNGLLMGVYVEKIITRTDNKTLFCSFVYADNYYVDRHALWYNLAGHANLMRDKQWVLLGDFNAALNLEDHSCGGYEANIAMREFKECVRTMEVMDVNATGLYFTWNKKHKGFNGVLKKINRIMCNIPFNDSFSGSVSIFQPYRISDHSPCVLRIPKVCKPKPKPFKFYNFLVYKEGFRSVVDTRWKINVNGCAMYRVVKRLKGLKSPLRKLLHDQGNLHDRVNRLRVELDEAQKAIDRNPSSSNLRDEHAHYLIEMVRDSAHNLYKGNDVAVAFVSHYEQFLGVEGNTVPLVNQDLFHQVLDYRKAEFMVREVSDVEIKSALFSMGDDKAPGLDGFTAAFFKKAWDTVGREVTCAIKEFFANGKLLKELNHTIVSLIPKVSTPGRRISDNILLTQELMRNYHRSRGPPRCAFKFQGKRGLRQGDPLSLYLFTLVMEVLTLILHRKVQEAEDFQFHHHYEKQRIINLCFANDLFLFTRGNPNYVQVIISALEEFKNVSGLVSSIPKSTAFFCNVPAAFKESILSSTPFAEGTLLVRFLGVPLI
ncbi:sodium/hydrogen exchanger 6 [Tanacetum coccineum]